MTKKLVKNAARCRACNSIIESKYRHDFVECFCGSIFVDGGLDYQRRGFRTLSDYEDLSEYEEVKE